MEKWIQNQKLTTFTRVVVLIALYFVGGLIGKETTFLSGSVALVWPPTGIALAAILLFGYRFWPGVALGAVLFSFMNGMPLEFFTLGTAFGNTIGAIVCTYLLKNSIAFNNAMESTRDVTIYIGLACFMGTTINAAFNVVSLVFGGVLAWDDLFSSILVWWVPNMLSGLVIAPIIITWATPSATRWNARLIAEACLCGAGLIAGTLISFNSFFVYGIQNYPLAYLPFPFLVWGSLRFGQRGATAGTLLVSSLAINSLLHGIGPFVTHTEKDSLMLMGSYIGILAVTNMLLAAAAAESRAAERAVSESEKRFRGYFELGLIGITITSPAQGCLEVNDKLCQILGCERSELLKMSWSKFIHPDDLAEEIGNYNRILAGECDGYSMEKRFIRKDGQIVHATIAVKCARRTDGSVDYLLTLIQDITERKKLEAQLFQSQKMETVGKLAGGIAHEFTSIMTAIIGQSELLLNDLPPGNRWRKNATEIRNAAERAAILTRQLLAYGRKQILRPEVMNMNTVVAGMESTLHHLLGPGTDMRLVAADGLKMVKADAGQIEQVIMNMAINAADAMQNGGKLTLETVNLTLNQEYASHFPDSKPGEYVMLAITDTGAGMSERVKARVFEPFFTTKEVGQGTGLGLATCYGIVKQSGGHITVDSELGRGTTFKIYLPQVEQQTNAPVQRLGSQGLPHGAETILLVEDDPALREMAAEMLKRQGYTVLTASNGIEALKLTQQSNIANIDLLFTDIAMPQMNGKDLSDRVRALYPRIRVLFTSGYTENAVVHRGVLDKGVSFLKKPFTPSELANKLREVLDQTDASNLGIDSKTRL